MDEMNANTFYFKCDDKGLNSLGIFGLGTLKALELYF